MTALTRYFKTSISLWYFF